MEIGGRGSFPRNTLGTATINIVLDHLGDFEIVSTPENPNRTVSWCSAPLPPDKQAPYDDRVTLYVIEASDAEELFAQRSHAIGLIALQQDEPFSPDAPPFPADLLRQLVIVRSKTPISKTKLLGAVMSTVYSCLFSIREWAANLAGIVSREGTIQELIDESEQLFDNFIDVNDSTYSLIARTKNIEPADPLSTELVRLGCHNLDAIKAAESIGAFGEWRDQSDINVFGPDETVPFKYITCVLKDRNSYAGHIVMVCNNHDATPGMMDMFRILSNSCQQIVAFARKGTSSDAKRTSRSSTRSASRLNARLTRQTRSSTCATFVSRSRKPASRGRINPASISKCDRSTTSTAGECSTSATRSRTTASTGARRTPTCGRFAWTTPSWTTSSPPSLATA